MSSHPDPADRVAHRAVTALAAVEAAIDRAVGPFEALDAGAVVVVEPDGDAFADA